MLNNNNPMNFMNGLFGQIGPNMCRISIDGKIAIKTKSGYKTFDVATNQLTQCANFALDVGEEFFFMIPTTNAMPGDIIVSNGLPVVVLTAQPNMLTVMRYEDGTILNIIPERHMFMGQTYFYGKIVSMFGNVANDPTQIFKFMLMKQFCGHMFDNNEYDDHYNKKNPMMAMMPMLFMANGGFANIFNNAFGTQPQPTPTQNPFDNMFNMFNQTAQPAAPVANQATVTNPLNTTPVAQTVTPVVENVVAENKEV